MWAAEDAMPECIGGDDGVPVAEVLDPVFNFADEEGTGSH